MSTSWVRLSVTRVIVLSMETWDCEAYGPDGTDVGALCFFAEQGQRACVSQAMCRLSMAGERQRMFDRIHALASQGDPEFVYLAGEFTSPDQLLGGPGATPADQRTGHPGTGQPPPG